MKISIELTAAETKGIKAYLSEVDGKKATNEDVKIYIKGIISITLYSPNDAVSDYINNESNK